MSRGKLFSFFCQHSKLKRGGSSRAGRSTGICPLGQSGGVAPLPGCACYRRVYSLMRMALFSISYVDVSRVNLHTNMRFAQRSRAQKKCGRQVSAPWGRASKYGTDFVKNPGLCMPYFSREPAIICIFARLSTTKQKRKPRMRFPFLWCTNDNVS